MIKLDKNYNIIEDKNYTYQDSFYKIVDEISIARAKEKITEREVALLLKLALRKKIGRELRAYLKSSFDMVKHAS
jgi:hypothetical protein